MKAKVNEISDRKTVDIFTYSLYTPGKSDYYVWIALISYKSTNKMLIGASNRANKSQAEKYSCYAELYSIYAALKVLKEPCVVHIYSNSQFVTSAINLNWIERWMSNGWHIHRVGAVPNTAIWTVLIPLLQNHEVTIEWVRFPEDVPKMQYCKEKAEQVLAQKSICQKYKGDK